MAYRNLAKFVIHLWPWVEKDPYVDGWHVEAICEHLEAVSRGEIRRLLINMPPRHMKSLAVSVFWPAWDWLHHPSRRFLYSSYAHSLSVRDSVKCRRLLQSPEYQAMIKKHVPQFELMGDQNTKIRFDNSYNGYRLATSVDGATTGEGGDIIVIDDPHNVQEGESEADRKNVLTWWDEAMSTRLNNTRTGSYVVVGQRVHEDDLSGHILEREKRDWVHLCLPARYEGENRIHNSPLNWTDPRTQDGEVLWPERIPDEVLGKLEITLGSYGTACQLQQSPSPREGGMFKVECLKRIKAFDRSAVLQSVRYWDKAATEGAGAYSASCLMHRLRSGLIVIEHVSRGQWSTFRREAMIKSQASIDGPNVSIYIEQEPGSGGKDSAAFTVVNLAGYAIHADRASQDKVRRAEPLACQVEAGVVCLVEGEWNQPFIDELRLFPKGKYKDQTDAATGGFNRLTLRKTGGVW